MNTSHRLFRVAIVLVFCILTSEAQDGYWQIVAHSSETWNTQKIDSVSEGFLFTTIDSAYRPIPLGSITALIYHTESYFWTGALIGAVVCAPIGGIIGRSTTGKNDIGSIGENIGASIVGAAVGAAVGFTAGGLAGSSTTRRYVIGEMSVEELQRAIQREQS